MIVKLLTEHQLEFLSLKGGCTGSSESTHVKMSHSWKSHALAQLMMIKMTILMTVIEMMMKIMKMMMKIMKMMVIVMMMFKGIKHDFLYINISRCLYIRKSCLIAIIAYIHFVA